VTIALDIDPEAARPWIERAKAEHPSLIDSRHVVDELFGVINVPNGVWIDEDGMIVRPAEPAAPERPARPDHPPRPAAPQPELSEHTRQVLEEARKIRIDPHSYTAALRDWAEHGSASRFALSPDEVIERSGNRGADESLAAALFEMGQWLWEKGQRERAQKYWREAHRLFPSNWTYQRQAWILADPEQGPTELYDSDWLSDVRKVGAENYYPPLQL
jgi:tetratricopeptide (TPR) repeat protein